MGAAATDHGVETAYTAPLGEAEADAIFGRALRGQASAEDARALHRAHAHRDGADERRGRAGDAAPRRLVCATTTGGSSSGSGPTRAPTSRSPRVHPQPAPAAGAFGNDPRLTLILFTLDETTYARELAPLAGHYPALRLGPPWWFHDSLNGMARYFDQVMETAGLYNTAGFNDDTRAFCSIPARHDVWRRASANWLAGLVVRGIVDEADAATWPTKWRTASRSALTGLTAAWRPDERDARAARRTAGWISSTSAGASPRSSAARASSAGPCATGSAAPVPPIAVMGRSAERGAARVAALEADGVRAAFVLVDATDLARSRPPARGRGPARPGRRARQRPGREQLHAVLRDRPRRVAPDHRREPHLGLPRLPGLRPVDDRQRCRRLDHQHLVGVVRAAPVQGARPTRSAKAGLNNLTQYLARELAPHRIRVNAIAPGFFPAEQNRRLLSEERVRAILAHTPAARLGEPDELVGAAVWLASGRHPGS